MQQQLSFPKPAADIWNTGPLAPRQDRKRDGGQREFSISQGHKRRGWLTIICSNHNDTMAPGCEPLKLLTVPKGEVLNYPNSLMTWNCKDLKKGKCLRPSKEATPWIIPSLTTHDTMQPFGNFVYNYETHTHKKKIKQPAIAWLTGLFETVGPVPSSASFTSWS